MALARKLIKVTPIGTLDTERQISTKDLFGKQKLEELGVC